MKPHPTRSCGKTRTERLDATVLDATERLNTTGFHKAQRLDDMRRHDTQRQAYARHYPAAGPRMTTHDPIVLSGWTAPHCTKRHHTNKPEQSGRTTLSGDTPPDPTK